MASAPLAVENRRLRSRALLQGQLRDIAISRQGPPRMVVSEKKSVKQIAMLALVVSSLCGSALCQYSAEFSRYYSGNLYEFRLTREQLSNTPARLEDESNPFIDLLA